MRTSEALRRGRAEIEKGWCQNALSKDGGVCAIGALMVAAGSDRDMIVAAHIDLGAHELLCRTAIGGSILDFNNHPGTTQADVLAWFDAALAIAEEQERAAGASSTGDQHGDGTQVAAVPVPEETAVAVPARS